MLSGIGMSRYERLVEEGGDYGDSQATSYGAA
jgi:hypothetical protein